MNTLLISCYELGRQPLSVASPAAYLLEAGLPVRALDLAVESLDAELVQWADFIGIAIPMHTAMRLGIKVAERVRSLNPVSHICFYGLYASLNESYLFRLGAQSVIGGEFEQPLVQFITHLHEGNHDAAFKIPGVSSPGNSVTPFLGRSQFLPPARHLLPPLERYAHLDTGSPDLPHKVVGCVEASHGCAHQCRHCPITPVYGGRLRVVQEQTILADIRTLVKMGAEHITFGDPDFLNGITHSLAIARQMHAEFPQLTFDMTTKIEHIRQHRAIFPELRQLGCILIQSAVESLNDTILGYLDKGHTHADVHTALDITRTAGIALRPSLLSFTPWTSISDYIMTLRFVEEQGLIYTVDPVQYAIRLLLPPGSTLLELPEIAPYLGPLDEEHFTYAWTHPDPRMDRLYKEVSTLVEKASMCGSDQGATFAEVKSLACAIAGLSDATAGTPVTDPELPSRRGSGFRSGRSLSLPEGARTIPPRPPRLTESWFC